MSELWLYENNGGESVVFDTWEDAVNYMLIKEICNTMTDFILELEENEVYHEFYDGLSLYVDDGTRIKQIEYRRRSAESN